MGVGDDASGSSNESDSSVGGAGVRVAMGGARIGATARTSEVPRGVVSGPGDCRGVDAGFEGAGFEEMAGSVLDGPLTEPSNRRISSSPEPNGQATGDESSKTTYCRFGSASWCILPSPYPKAHDQCIPQTFDPLSLFLRNQNCERWVSEASVWLNLHVLKDLHST